MLALKPQFGRGAGGVGNTCVIVHDLSVLRKHRRPCAANSGTGPVPGRDEPSLVRRKSKRKVSRANLLRSLTQRDGCRGPDARTARCFKERVCSVLWRVARVFTPSHFGTLSRSRSLAPRSLPQTTEYIRPLSCSSARLFGCYQSAGLPGSVVGGYTIPTGAEWRDHRNRGSDLRRLLDL